MKARALVINEDVRDHVKALVEYASLNVVSRDMLRRIVELDDPAIGDRPEYRMEVPVGFDVVFSIEDQPPGLFRHLSVRVDGAGWPAPEAVALITQLFGFSEGLPAKIVEAERTEGVQAVEGGTGVRALEKQEDGDGTWCLFLETNCRAVNIMELIS